VAITLIPALIGTIAVDFFHVSTPLFIAALVLVLFKSVPLWWRRTQPVAVLVIVTAALLAGELLGLAQVASDGAVILASRHWSCSSRRSRASPRGASLCSRSARPCWWRG
jgi:hypothetical protein